MIAILGVLLLGIFAAHPASGQDVDGVPAGGTVVPDSVGTPDMMDVSNLDEQLPDNDDGEELEREVSPGTPDSPPQRWSGAWRVRASGVLQEPAGYAGGQYAGNRFRIYQRLTLGRGDRFGLGVLTEKDPGETAHTDFISGALSVGHLPGGSRIVIGDFRVRAGQGLLFGSPRSYGKGGATIHPVLRGGTGILEALSSDEVNHFRGVVVSASAGPASATLFGSWNKHSPRVSTGGALTGIDRSGYHRTAAELALEGLLSERSYGGMISVRVAPWLAVGMNALRSIYSPGTNGGMSAAFSGFSSEKLSVDFRIGFPAVTLFGEALRSGGRIPWIAGALFAPTERTRVVLVRRCYPAAHEFDRTFGFADGSTGRNEAGTYLGAELMMFPGGVLAGYLDLISAPSPDRGALFPPAGIDRLISVRVEPSRRWWFGALVRYRSFELTVEESPGTVFPGPANGVRSVGRLRGEIGWSPAERLSCRVRTEFSAASPGPNRSTENGSMIFADLSFEPVRGISLRSRILFFDTDSFASGIYTAEADLPGTLTGTLLNGEGTRWYVVCAARVSKHFRIAARYSRYRRDDVRKLGSGPDEMPSNIVEKAGFQLDFTL